jgi:hypothetical protein|tara:strand:+ start:1105 stop:1491 length:387 start_codon:yes stop_codon:yes gene_type:complete
MKSYEKIVILYIGILFFTLIYASFSPIHFTGINMIQDKIKDNLSEQVAVEGFQFDMDKEIIKQEANKLVDNENEKIKSPSYLQRLMDSFYFSTNTACLLGYGDIHPNTNLSKLVVSIQGITTISLLLF